MRITEIEWTQDAILHIARHSVEPNEVEEAFFNLRPFIFKARYKRYYALGQADSGRYLAVVFEHLGQGKAEIITARAMSESERRLYQRR